MDFLCHFCDAGSIKANCPLARFTADSSRDSHIPEAGAYGRNELRQRRLWCDHSAYCSLCVDTGCLGNSPSPSIACIRVSSCTLNTEPSNCSRRIMPSQRKRNLGGRDPDQLKWPSASECHLVYRATDLRVPSRPRCRHDRQGNGFCPQWAYCELGWKRFRADRHDP